MNLLLFLVPLCASVSGTAQQSAPSSATESDAAFRDLESAYKLELQAYDQARLDAARGKGERPARHPAIAYWPRMEEAAKGGSARARQWMCENLLDGVTDPAARLGVLETQIQALLACCAGDPALLPVPRILRTQAPNFGTETSMRHLDRIAVEATNPEVQARALLESAYLTDDRGNSPDPAKRARGAELEAAVVTAFPTTRAAREAAELLSVALQQEFLDGMRDWLTKVEAALAAGSPVAEWPAVPLTALAPRFELLSLTGFQPAKLWIQDLYPRFVQVSKLTPDLMASGLARDLAGHYSPRHPEWGPVRMRLFAVALRAHGGEAPWLRGAIDVVGAEVPEIHPLGVLPFTTAILDLAKSSEARSMALWIEAQSRLAEGSEAEFARALAALDTIRERHADMTGLVPKAASLAERVRAVMPGSPLPDSRTAEWALKDADDLELVLSGYRGKVLLIDVFDLGHKSTPDMVAERRELLASLAGKPFEVVGLCSTRLTLPVARKSFAEAGITWRIGLLQTRVHPYPDMLFARRLPTASVLVDADGVIRARNRPFAEMAQLATELTLAREKAAKR